MNSLNIKTFPDPCLRIKTKPVDQFTNDIKKTVDEMAEIMYLKQGIGLAATQVGLGLNIIVMDTGSGLRHFINPEIISKSDDASGMEEGCLSLPGIVVHIKRPSKVKVRAQDVYGEYFIKSLDGLTATAILHEMDHLNGKLIIDYLNPIKKFFVKRKLAMEKTMNADQTCEVICNVGTKD